MRRKAWIGLLVLSLAVLAAQAIPVSRTNPPVTGDIAAPPEIAATLRGACYDCHSNETAWPWYSHVAPVSWLLASDVGEGRQELNFSAWTSYSDKKKGKKLKEMADEIRDGEMPPWYYEIMHGHASMNELQRDALLQWIAGESAKAGH
jgi:hypothetical protein